MKKVLTIAAVLVMILALSLSAFAAELSYSVSYGDQTVAVNGGTVTVSSADKNATNEDALLDAIEQAGIAADAKVVVLDFAPSAGVTFPAVVTFAVDDVNALSAILHWNGTAWETISFTKNADGTVSATFNSLSPVALVYGAAAAPAGPATTPAGPQRSPQTGYNTVLWIIMAAAMVSLAGYCFVSARKETQE